MLVRRVDILSVFTLMISSLRFMWEEGWETRGATDLVGRAFASDFEHFVFFSCSCRRIVCFKYRE
jgi:hypothetical protein